MERRSRESRTIFPDVSVDKSDSTSRQQSVFSDTIVINDEDGEEKKRLTVISCDLHDEDDESIYIPFNVKREQLPKESFIIATAQKWLPIVGKNGRIHKFPVKSTLPKVQMTKVVKRQRMPRDVAVERRRKQYSKINLEEELEKTGLNREEIMPTEEQYFILSEHAFKHFLPLSFFDMNPPETHSPEEWLKLGQIETGEIYPVPAKAFLPINQSLIEYRWQFASLSSYNYDTDKWTAMAINDECVYEIPSIQVMFLGENPQLFIDRLKSAVAKRNTAENIIMLETIIDCVTMHDLNENRYYPNKLVTRLMEKVKASPTVKQTLFTEIYLLFEHLNASYEFEKFCNLLPKEFPQFTGTFIRDNLPKAYPSIRNEIERNFVKSFNISIKMLRRMVLSSSLYYTKAGIKAMQNVVEECHYVETLRIFICSIVKPMGLTDFIQIQQQNSTTVTNYLKGMWPAKLSNGITLVLRALGKGWLDISLNQWSVYQMCKISRFIEQVKFRMQESVHTLLDMSIKSFTNLLCDPCENFLNLDENYTWTNDYIETEFPAVKPIFTMVLSVTEDRKIVYSTDPKDFAPQIKDTFKKSIEKSNAIRCINAETLVNLRFAPNLYILTVETIEDLYILCDERIHNCYSKAVYPLNSYAHKYDRYIDFYLLNVQTYMQQYKAANKTSAQVKHDILEHKRNKEEMRQILPASIVIGPFSVIVDPMKQSMIRKRIEIVKRIFEYYVDRMYDINEQLLERGMEIYKKIHERPQSIEHLYEIRDFAVTVPDLVDQLRADIQIMLLEYDMLDGFFYNIPDHQFAMKWDTYAWPKTILDRLTTLREEQKVDIEDFKRLHASECVGFEERLESLNDEVQAFSLIFNPEKVHETANEIKKIWRVINELEKLGEILAYRQELFELEPLSLEFLESIIISFTPYKNLWYACLDIVKLEDATVGNPLQNIELDDVWDSLQAIQNTLRESLNVFAEMTEIQDVAKYYLNQIEEFIPKFNAIKDLKNEHWLLLHWQELANRSGLDVKYSLGINFQYLIRKGILSYLDLIHEIAVKAVNEADAIKQQILEEEMRKAQEAEEILLRKAKRKCRTDIL